MHRRAAWSLAHVALLALLGCAGSPTGEEASPRSSSPIAEADRAALAAGAERVDSRIEQPWPARFRRRGFSVERPPGDRWWIREREQNQDTLLYRHLLRPQRRDREHHNQIDSEAGQGEPDTQFFYAALRRWARVPESNEAFDAFARELITGGLFPDSVEAVSHEMAPSSLQGQYCIRFRAEAREASSAQSERPAFLHHDQGLICQHPGAWDTYFLARHSARVRKGPPSAATQRAAEALLRGLVLETAPGVPVVAEPSAETTAAGLPRVQGGLRKATCEDLVGMWVRVPLDDPSINEVDPWPQPYQWFGFGADGFLSSMNMNEPGDFSADQLGRIFRPHPERTPRYECRNGLLIVRYPFAGHNELWTMQLVAYRSALFKKTPFEAGEVILFLKAADDMRTVYRRRLRRVR